MKENRKNEGLSIPTTISPTTISPTRIPSTTILPSSLGPSSHRLFCGVTLKRLEVSGVSLTGSVENFTDFLQRVRKSVIQPFAQADQIVLYNLNNGSLKKLDEVPSCSCDVFVFQDKQNSPPCNFSWLVSCRGLAAQEVRLADAKTGWATQGLYGFFEPVDFTRVSVEEWTSLEPVLAAFWLSLYGDAILEAAPDHTVLRLFPSLPLGPRMNFLSKFLRKLFRLNDLSLTLLERLSENASCDERLRLSVKKAKEFVYLPRCISLNANDSISCQNGKFSCSLFKYSKVLQDLPDTIPSLSVESAGKLLDDMIKRFSGDFGAEALTEVSQLCVQLLEYERLLCCEDSPYQRNRPNIVVQIAEPSLFIETLAMLDKYDFPMISSFIEPAKTMKLLDNSSLRPELMTPNVATVLVLSQLKDMPGFGRGFIRQSHFTIYTSHFTGADIVLPDLNDNLRWFHLEAPKVPKLAFFYSDSQFTVVPFAYWDLTEHDDGPRDRPRLGVTLIFSGEHVNGRKIIARNLTSVAFSPSTNTFHAVFSGNTNQPGITSTWDLGGVFELFGNFQSSPNTMNLLETSLQKSE